jgi:hypothetical protein
MHHLIPTLALAALTCLAVPGQAQVADGGDDNVAPELARHQAEELARGDPARWFQEDLTPEAKLRTGSKEAAAALRENQADCKKLGARDRRDCMQQAQQTYREEMQRARQKAYASR